MTPKFAQHVDPIVEQVIDLLLDVEKRRSRSGEQEWKSLDAKLQVAERELSNSHGTTWQLAKFALVAWIDESVRHLDGWTGREYWMKNPFEWKHFQSGESHEWFFVKCKEAEAAENGDDALETYYVCGMLGFRGFYKRNEPTDPKLIDLAAQKYDLPTSFRRWARQTGRTLRDRRKLNRIARSAEPKERRIRTAKPMWPQMRLVWPWLLVALCGALNFVVWWNELNRR